MNWHRPSLLRRACRRGCAALEPIAGWRTSIDLTIRARSVSRYGGGVRIADAARLECYHRFPWGSREASACARSRRCDKCPPHYAGRAYQRFGCPIWMPGVLRKWKAKFPGGRLTVFFHEVPGELPRLSRHFLLGKIGERIVRQLAAVADVLVTNTDNHAAILRRLSGRDRGSLPPCRFEHRTGGQFVAAAHRYGVCHLWLALRSLADSASVSDLKSGTGMRADFSPSCI